MIDISIATHNQNLRTLIKYFMKPKIYLNHIFIFQPIEPISKPMSQPVSQSVL